MLKYNAKIFSRFHFNLTALEKGYMDPSAEAWTRLNDSHITWSSCIAGLKLLNVWAVSKNKSLRSFLKVQRVFPWNCLVIQGRGTCWAASCITFITYPLVCVQWELSSLCRREKISKIIFRNNDNLSFWDKLGLRNKQRTFFCFVFVLVNNYTWAWGQSKRSTYALKLCWEAKLK